MEIIIFITSIHTELGPLIVLVMLVQLAVFTLLAAMPDDRPWAVITGASSGIGAAIAHEASMAGYNTILCARRRSQLSDIAKSLSVSFGTCSIIVATDLADEQGVRTLCDVAENADVELLVLNAGICASPAAFVEQDGAELGRMLSLNVQSSTALLHHFGARFATTHKGRILVVASSAGAAPGVPGVAYYAASKSFLRSLAAGVGGELRSKGVSVTCGLPGAVDTEFASRSGLSDAAVFSLPGVRKIGGVVVSAERAARVMLAATLRGQREVVPGVLPRIYVSCAGLLPSRLSRSIAAFSFGRSPMRAKHVPYNYKSKA